MKMPKGTKEVFGITGMSLGLGFAGKATESISPAISADLYSAGEASAGFIKPAVNISMGGTVIGMIKNLKDVKK